MAKRTTRRRKSPAKSRSRRRASRRSVSRGGMGLRGFINKDLLVMSGGVLAGSMGANILIGKLRGMTKADGTPMFTFLQPPKPAADGTTPPDYTGAAITAGIGILGGVLLKKVNPKLATMVAVGGVAAAAGNIVGTVLARHRNDAITNLLPPPSTQPALPQGTSGYGDGDLSGYEAGGAIYMNGYEAAANGY